MIKTDAPPEFLHAVKECFVADGCIAVVHKNCVRHDSAYHNWYIYVKMGRLVLVGKPLYKHKTYPGKVLKLEDPDVFNQAKAFIAEADRTKSGR